MNKLLFKERKNDENKQDYHGSPSGACSFDLSSMGVPEGNEFYGETFSTGKYYYKGYRDLDSLFNKQITAKIDKYAYENTVKQ